MKRRTGSISSTRRDQIGRTGKSKAKGLVLVPVRWAGGASWARERSVTNHVTSLNRGRSLPLPLRGVTISSSNAKSSVSNWTNRQPRPSSARVKSVSFTNNQCHVSFIIRFRDRSPKQTGTHYHGKYQTWLFFFKTFRRRLTTFGRLLFCQTDVDRPVTLDPMDRFTSLCGPWLYLISKGRPCFFCLFFSQRVKASILLIRGILPLLLYFFFRAVPFPLDFLPKPCIHSTIPAEDWVSCQASPHIWFL